VIRQQRASPGFDERLVRRDKGETVDEGRCNQEAVCRIRMHRHDLTAANRHVESQSGFLRWNPGEGVSDPFVRLGAEFHPAALGENQEFPSADRRYPQLVRCSTDGCPHGPPQSVRFGEAPKPDVRVEQKLQRLIAGQSPGPVVGPTMSPIVRAVPAIEPSQSEREARRRGGTTSATGRPKRVINTGRPVRFTRWTTARQVALNLDTGMLSIRRAA
jgi:hypothetical protein